MEPGTRGSFLEVINTESPMWMILEAGTRGHLKRQRQFRLYIPFLGIARPQPQYTHSCVCERFIYSQDPFTYFLQKNRQIDRGNMYINCGHRHMNVEIRIVAPQFLFWEYLFRLFSTVSLQCVWKYFIEWTNNFLLVHLNEKLISFMYNVISPIRKAFVRPTYNSGFCKKYEKYLLE